MHGTRSRLAASIDARLQSSHQCQPMDQMCWVKQPFASKSQQIQKAVDTDFKPIAPKSWEKNKNAWLSNEDIGSVMKQYEEADSKFRFVGTFPIDFAAKDGSGGVCISEHVCRLNLSKEKKKGVTKLGFVFNTDPHDKNGQHWIAAYVGLDPSDRNFGVFYYDSVTKPTPPQIKRFMDNIARMSKDLKLQTNRPFRVEENKVRRQFKGTECGIFVMLFLIYMRTQPFANVCKSMGTDDEVEAFRSVLFRREK